MELKPSAFWRQYNIPKATVYDLIKKGELVLNTGKKLDTDNKQNAAIIKKYYKKSIQKESVKSPDNTEQKTLMPDDLVAEAMGVQTLPSDVLKLTLYELYSKYGSIENLIVQSKALNNLLDAQAKVTKEESIRGNLIERKLVEIKIFGTLNNLFENIDDAIPNFINEAISLFMTEGESCKPRLNDMLQKKMFNLISNSIDIMKSGLNV